MSTFTGNYATANVQPRGIQAGVNAVYGVYSASATLSDTDVIRLVKLPDNARIVDVILSTGEAAAAATGFLSVGTPANATQFIKSASSNVAGGIQHMNVVTGLGAALDVSDSGGAKYTIIQATYSNASTTGTASQVVACTVLYHLDQYSPGITP